MSSWISRRHRSSDGFCSRGISGYRVTEVGHAAATDRRPNKLRSKMTDLLDALTRTYEYQRAQPAFWGGTMSGIERAHLVLDGKLPTPPIVATLGISLVEAAEGRAVFEGSPAEWQYNQLATVQG